MAMRMLKNRPVRLILLSLLVVIPVGFFTKWYPGPASGWVQDNLGGLLYVVFWCLVARLAFQKAAPYKIAGIVLVVTCCLEVLQLWHPAPLECIRSTFLGRTVLGTTFAWLDFPYYFVGAALGWYWIKRLPFR